MTLDHLRRLPWFTVDQSGVTTYAWSDVSTLKMDGPEVAAGLLVNAGVLISPGNQFGPQSHSYSAFAARAMRVA